MILETQSPPFLQQEYCSRNIPCSEHCQVRASPSYGCCQGAPPKGPVLSTGQWSCSPSPEGPGSFSQGLSPRPLALSNFSCLSRSKWGSLKDKKHKQCQLCGAHERLLCGAEGIRDHSLSGDIPHSPSWGHWVSLPLGHAVTGNRGKRSLWEQLGLLLVVKTNPTLESMSQSWK